MCHCVWLRASHMSPTFCCQKLAQASLTFEVTPARFVGVMQPQFSASHDVRSSYSELHIPSICLRLVSATNLSNFSPVGVRETYALVVLNWYIQGDLTFLLNPKGCTVYLYTFRGSQCCGSVPWWLPTWEITKWSDHCPACLPPRGIPWLRNPWRSTFLAIPFTLRVVHNCVVRRTFLSIHLNCPSVLALPLGYLFSDHFLLTSLLGDTLRGQPFLCALRTTPFRLTYLCTTHIVSPFGFCCCLRRTVSLRVAPSPLHLVYRTSLHSSG